MTRSLANTLMIALSGLGSTAACSSDAENPDAPSAGAVGKAGSAAGMGEGSGASGQAGGSGGASSGTLRGECDIATRVGRFSVEGQSDFGVVQGAVFEGVVPTAIPRLVSEAGPCRLLERRNLVCTPACVGSRTCGEDGACIPYPRQLSVGDVTISGLTQPTNLSPQNPGNGYFAPGAENPPFAVGSEVTLTAKGESGRAGFELKGFGSAPLGTKPTWLLERGKSLSVLWQGGDSGARTRVTVELSVDQHGISPLTLACELEDTGTASIPASVVDGLLDSGVSGFPNGRIFRRTADRVLLDIGCVDLLVGSPLAADVTVAGVVPCKKAAECPMGQTCNVMEERCE
jgi:hypothetical protein